MKLDYKDFEKMTNETTYEMSDRERTITNYVNLRYEEMKNNRRISEKNWFLYQKMIDANYKQYSDGRSSSTVPLARAMIELYVADAIKLQTEFKFKSDAEKYKTNAKVLEHVWKYDWRKNNRKKIFIKNEYDTAGFGT